DERGSYPSSHNPARREAKRPVEIPALPAGPVFGPQKTPRHAKRILSILQPTRPSGRRIALSQRLASRQRLPSRIRQSHKRIVDGVARTLDNAQIMRPCRTADGNENRVYSHTAPIAGYSISRPKSRTLSAVGSCRASTSAPAAALAKS